MTWLLLAGGFAIAASHSQASVLYNHTLKGERIPAADVVCRNRWGTPMLPDGKGGYSLIAPINQGYIAQSLAQPPSTGAPVYRPALRQTFEAAATPTRRRTAGAARP